MKNIRLENFNLFYFLKIFIFIFSLPLFIINFYGYENSKIIYIIFTIVTFIFIHYSINKKSSLFGLFISIFLFLGFWFKFTINSIFENKFLSRTGYFDFSSKSVDDVLIISSLAILGFFIPCLFQDKIKKVFTNKKIEFNNLKNFYIKNKIIIISFLYIIIFFVFFTNLNYHIYQRGYISNSDSSIFYYLYAWLLQFGFTSFFCFIVFLK